MMKKGLVCLCILLFILSPSFGENAMAANNTHSIPDKVERKMALLGYDQNGFYVEEEPNNLFEAANAIVLEDAVTGRLTKEDIDVFKITLESDDPFYLYGGSFVENSSLNLDVTLYDEEYHAISPSAFEKDETGGVYAEYSISSGTYYIEVKDHNNAGNEEEYFFISSQYTMDTYVDRLAGMDRYETALAIAYRGWFGGTDEILLATGDNFPDALAGAPLAYYKDAPILLTTKDALHETVKEAIYELGIEKVTIIGGTGAISKNVEDDLKNKYGVRTMRISGVDRYETAVAISKKLPQSDTAIVVSGTNFPDALSVASFAAQYGYPILLSEKAKIPSATLDQSKSYSSSYVIGGTDAINNLVFSKLNKPIRISGQDRYETSVNVVSQLNMDTTYLFLATGTKFADALTGSVLAAYWGEPLLLTPPSKLNSQVRDIISENTYGVTILGGTSVMNKSLEDEIRLILQRD
ncbi:cell wall-binding repeat-containing protein [Rossellomorea aquimaris]|uniref:cell wall-binding repeat-containing protein n=1 Tax=Rossellomorea aquimaris TaxID=189382 RepID=UPI001CD797B1|nr:cell wall-binding repeat-containing protein [Rossellomorea aquimaris]MCA1060814.1 cell wall-binding repeat-containing protein [Rossellomorea aquimaris]